MIFYYIDILINFVQKEKNMVNNPAVGDIFYCVKRIDAIPIVSYGVVGNVWHSECKLCLNYLDLVENRIINGIPIEKFERTKYKKLPKGWTYNTKLYEITYSDIREKIRESILKETGFDVNAMRIDKPGDLEIAYKYGLLVESENKFRGRIDVDITKNGYSVYKRYYGYYDAEYTPTHNTYNFWDVYETYQEAQGVIDSYNAELQRQAALTDEEWSIEQIIKTIEKYANLKQLAPEMKERYKNELLSFNNIVDLETRISGGCIQWKYEKNKRWNTLYLEEQL